ncbi:MAG TPA: hypothetical protein VFY79_09365, partial [Dehalococcoidia bacterium]|nr:hypothetical protein [Dehalococcoidia bacterium]
APPNKAIAFIKTALLRIDRAALSAIDPLSPHPLAVKGLMQNAAVYHATALPMRHVRVPGMRLYDAVRRIIFESISDPDLEGEVLTTLKWIAYEQWDGHAKALAEFQCPHCESPHATLPYDASEGQCPECKQVIYLTDMLGFHLEMADEAAPDTIASSYMLVHETLLLFTAIRYFWTNNRSVLATCLFLKDGPLSIRAQYSKLVNPIRRFLAYANENGVPVSIVGQEKTGAFCDHLDVIAASAPVGTVFIPSHNYIREEVQHRPPAGAPYGIDTNYGAKVFTRLTARHHAVLSIPTGLYKQDPVVADLIGAPRIFATLPGLLSARYEGGLFPIELANNIASLSTYPSAKVLALFAEAMGSS